MRVALALILLVMVPFAGCLDDEAGSLMSAQEAFPRAEKRALAWDSQAQVASVSTLEIGPDAREELQETLAEARMELAEARRDCMDADDADDRAECEAEIADAQAEIKLFETVLASGGDRVGDGRSVVWIFVFVVPNTPKALGLAVTSTRVILEKDFSDRDGESYGMPLGNWTIDSTAAAKIAADSNSDYADAVGKSDAGSVMLLMQAGDKPYWLLNIFLRSGGAMVAVNAQTGEVVPFEDVFGFLMPIIQEFGSTSGTFTAAVGTTGQANFEIEQERHQALAVHVRISPPPVQPVAVEVTDADGEKAQFTVRMTVGQTAATGSVLLDSVPDGTYSVRLTNPLATRESWTVSWCTDGFGMLAGPFAPAACSLIPDGSSARMAPAEMISQPWRLPGL